MKTLWIKPFSASLQIKSSLLIVAALLTFFVLKNTFFSSTPVKVVDVRKIKGQFIRQIAEYKLSDTKIHAASVRFNQVLKQSLKEYSDLHHTVLVTKEAVIAYDKKPGDATVEVMQLVSKHMKKGAAHE